MEVISAVSQLNNTKDAVQALFAELKRHQLPTSLLVYYTQDYSPAELWRELHHVFNHTSILGCSSCKGVMTEKGFFESPVIAVLAIYDKGNNAYGSGLASFNDHTSIFSAVEQCIDDALLNANRVGEVPNMAILHSTPGYEEDVISAIDNKFGTRVPIIGGSAADTAIAKNWSVLTEKGITQSGIAIQLQFPNASVITEFSAGYSPTECVGLVTQSQGRLLQEIDGEPAKDLYKDWISDHSNIQISDEFMFQHVTRFPLGRIVTDCDGQPYYRLTHPIRITEEGELELFANMEKGEEVTLMTGSHEQLITRAARTIRETEARNHSASSKHGAIIIFCAGAMLRLGADMPNVQAQIKTELNGYPFICPFTFGEQGRFPDGANAHGNLMIASAIYYDREGA